ncbi:MAG: 6-bladed beta-propeller [Thermodesulfobacteriota bacterium]
MKKTLLSLLLLMAALTGCASQRTRPAGNPEPVYYPPAPSQPRLQYLYSINSEKDLGKAESALHQFIFGVLPPEHVVGYAYSIAAGPGKIYFVDRSTNRLLAINLAEKRMDEVQSRGRGALQNPSGICLDPRGNVYVADMGRKQVVVFGPDGSYSREYGGPDIMGKPVDAAVSMDRLYVCDYDKNRVLVMDLASGKVLRTVGELGSDPGRFYKPTHLATDAEGNLYVNDSFNSRVQKFDSEGKQVQSFGKIGDLPGNFVRPKGIAVSREGQLYALDAAFENAQIFDANTGQLLLDFGGPGTGPGNMYLPSGICLDYDNAEYFSGFFGPNFRVRYLVWVTNRFGDNKINIYGFGDLAEPVAAR